MEAETQAQFVKEKDRDLAMTAELSSSQQLAMEFRVS